ncbi:hypothetical protein PAXRUDRAFT_802063, partial [Paxillus rubicundulus Ve08.2h10]
MILQAVSHPLETLEDLAQELNLDIGCILAICQTQDLQGWPPVCMSSSLHLAWEYAQSPSNHHHFINMLCVSLKFSRSFCHLSRIIQSFSTILAVL